MGIRFGIRGTGESREFGRICTPDSNSSHANHRSYSQASIDSRRRLVRTPPGRAGRRADTLGSPPARPQTAPAATQQQQEQQQQSWRYLQARKNSPRGMSAGRARVAKACTTHTCIHSPTHLDMRTRAQTRNHTTHVRVHIHTSKSIIPHATCEHRREHRRVRLNLTYLKRTGRDPGRRDSTSK